jgi:hypothetical protein
LDKRLVGLRHFRRGFRHRFVAADPRVVR